MKIIVFQENGSGERKIHGIQRFAPQISIVRIVDVEGTLPPVIDDPQEFIDMGPEDIHVDLCLNFLRHPDLSQFVVDTYNVHGIPVVASGQKVKGAHTPVTCCTLGAVKGLGEYGRCFGAPRLEVTLSNGVIKACHVLRGASCGATWEALEKIKGLAPEEALHVYAREIQYKCCADPSNFDPISGRSQLHVAGDIHKSALRAALKRAKEVH